MKRPPSVTWECIKDRETFFSKTPCLCPDCGQPLTVRPEGAEPFGAPPMDDESEEARVSLVVPVTVRRGPPLTPDDEAAIDADKQAEHRAEWLERRQEREGAQGDE
jgi:hypothetical protein